MGNGDSKKSLDDINSQRYHEGRAPITMDSIREERASDLNRLYGARQDLVAIASMKEDSERALSGRPPLTYEEKCARRDSRSKR